MSKWMWLYLEVTSGTSRCHCQPEDEPNVEKGTHGMQTRASCTLPLGGSTWGLTSQ